MNSPFLSLMPRVHRKPSTWPTGWPGIAAEPFRVADRDIPMTASVGEALSGGFGLGRCCATLMWPCRGPRKPGAGASRCSPRTCTRRRCAAWSCPRNCGGHHRRSLGIEYQPLVELATSRVTGVEALIRWSPPGSRCHRASPGRRRGLRADRAAGRLGAARGVLQVAAWRRRAGRSACRSTLAAAAARPGSTSRCWPPWRPRAARGALTLEVTDMSWSGRPDGEGLAQLRHRASGWPSTTSAPATHPGLPARAADRHRQDRSFFVAGRHDGTLALLTGPSSSGSRPGHEVVAEGIERPSSWSCAGHRLRPGQGYLVARPMAARGIEALRRRRAERKPGPTRKRPAVPTPAAAGPPAGQDRPGGRGEAPPTDAPGPRGAAGRAEPPGAPHDAPAAAPAT